jgi:hypothetical protein
MTGRLRLKKNNTISFTQGGARDDVGKHPNGHGQ